MKFVGGHDCAVTVVQANHPDIAVLVGPSLDQKPADVVLPPWSGHYVKLAVPCRNLRCHEMHASSSASDGPPNALWRYVPTLLRVNEEWRLRVDLDDRAQRLRGLLAVGPAVRERSVRRSLEFRWAEISGASACIGHVRCSWMGVRSGYGPPKDAGRPVRRLLRAGSTRRSDHESSAFPSGASSQVARQ